MLHESKKYDKRRSDDDRDLVSYAEKIKMKENKNKKRKKTKEKGRSSFLFGMK